MYTWHLGIQINGKLLDHNPFSWGYAPAILSSLLYHYFSIWLFPSANTKNKHAVISSILKVSKSFYSSILAWLCPISFFSFVPNSLVLSIFTISKFLASQYLKPIPIKLLLLSLHQNCLFMIITSTLLSQWSILSPYLISPSALNTDDPPNSFKHFL